MNDNGKGGANRPDHRIYVLLALGLAILVWNSVSFIGTISDVSSPNEADIVLQCGNKSVVMWPEVKGNRGSNPRNLSDEIADLPQFIRPVLFLPLSLNRADRELLQTIPGLGPVLSGSIVDFRRSEGKITSYDQLLEINGIGACTLKKIKAHSVL